MLNILEIFCISMPMQNEIYRVDALFLVTLLLYEKFICFLLFFFTFYASGAFFRFVHHMQILFLLLSTFLFHEFCCFYFYSLLIFSFIALFVWCAEIYMTDVQSSIVCVCAFFPFCYSVKILESRIKYKDEKSYSISPY